MLKSKVILDHICISCHARTDSSKDFKTAVDSHARTLSIIAEQVYQRWGYDNRTCSCWVFSHPVLLYV